MSFSFSRPFFCSTVSCCAFSLVLQSSHCWAAGWRVAVFSSWQQIWVSEKRIHVEEEGVLVLWLQLLHLLFGGGEFWKSFKESPDHSWQRPSSPCPSGTGTSEFPLIRSQMWQTTFSSDRNLKDLIKFWFMFVCFVANQKFSVVQSNSLVNLKIFYYSG
jgi:hypothetical protein